MCEKVRYMKTMEGGDKRKEKEVVRRAKRCFGWRERKLAAREAREARECMMGKG